MDALDVIARSEVNHARLAIQAGARGIFLAIQNANPEILNEDEYAKFSEPFDKLIPSGVSTAPLNVLHLHGDHVYWKRFTRGWTAAGINYSSVGTKAPIKEVRAEFPGVILGGDDESRFPKLTLAELRQQAAGAHQQTGKNFVLTPGCPVPDETTDLSIRRLRSVAI